MPNFVVKLTSVGKKYNLSHQKPSLIGNILGQSKQETFWALKNVSLSIRKGDKIGIIGSNGAGKTTLLKIIAGITKQTIGEVKTNGRIVALLDLEAGFHPDLTGEENIYINGILAGMSRAEIGKKYKQIINFADIDKFINAPFYTYSSGMKFRLAFAVAIASRCDVLILDEIFAAGDLNFQRKSFSYLKKVQENKDLTMIMCSHMPLFIWEFSKNFYIIEDGEISPTSKSNILRIRKKMDAVWKKMFPHALP